MGDQRLGSTEPRIYTPELRSLTPASTLGFEFIDFAQEVVGIELLPWQRWWALHAFELNEDGRFRYRTIVTLVARQNGKTILMRLVALWGMFMGHFREVLGTAQALDLARETWEECIGIAQDIPDLAEDLAGKPRRANGQEEFRLLNGSRYRIAAANRKAGRGKTIDLLLVDELREWLTDDAWGALSKTTNARPNSIKLAFSNAGDDRSIVLNNLRASALSKRSKKLAIFEWSAPDGAALDDREGWSQANPSLGYTIDEDAIESDMASDPPAIFRTEVLCQRVESLNEAIDYAAWRTMADPGYLIETIEKPRVVLGLDVSLDGSHVSLIATAKSADGLYYVEPIDGWDSIDEAKLGDPEHEIVSITDWVNRIKPAAFAWLPGGPAGALAPELRALANLRFTGQRETLPVVEVSGTGVKEACQGFADLTASRRIAHPGDPMLDAHVSGAQRWDKGDGWVYARRGSAPIDGLYAASAAVHVLRGLPDEGPKRSFIY